MASIRGSGNKRTELRLIQIFRTNGVTGWRRGSKLLGKPDFVFPRRKWAVFVDGCFWHGCPMHGTKPKTNASFWQRKLAGNRKRDRKVSRLLRSKGWKVLRIWEHELSRQNETRILTRLLWNTSRVEKGGARSARRDAANVDIRNAKPSG